ncbi:sigma-70 region 4 domain-containing protein [Candidatus Woesearchaeota archaeon]|nr:sigma-70 region 4 domain-containing protein [Candidatus Woesearchaeota archaeon]
MHRKKTEKSGKNEDFSSYQNTKKELEKLKKDYNITSEDIAKFQRLKQFFDKQFFELTTDLEEKDESKDVVVPVSVFSEKLSCLETVVKYLKENLGLNCKEIASLLNRSEKTIYQAYAFARKKFSKKFVVEISEFNFPATILRDRKLGVLEIIVKFLHEKCHLSFAEIARLLHRDPRTIWTTYSRGKKKHA